MTIGKQGTTIIFSIPNLVLGGSVLSWDNFKFYTPEGDLVEAGTGYKYFNIPADSVPIERYDTYYREVFVCCINGQVDARGFYTDEEVVLPNFGLGGNILVKVSIPPIGDPGEILVEEWEVVDG